MAGKHENEVAVVIVGRDEGERLKRCLQSVVGDAGHVVYVDSGSIDGSVDFARELCYFPLFFLIHLETETAFFSKRQEDAPIL